MLKQTIFSTLISLSLSQSVLASPFSDLEQAINNDNLAAARKALQQKANPNELHTDSTSCLLADAALKGNLEMVNLLLSYGAKPNLKGCDVLSSALLSENARLAELLVSKGADQSALISSGPQTLVNMVIAKNKPMIEWLLKHKVNINALAISDSDSYEVDMGYAHAAYQMPPLMHAVKGDNLEMVRYLQSKGAGINTRAETGDTPLMLALDLNTPQLFNYLLSQHADVKLANQAGETPLSKAINLNKPEQVKTLLAYGADPQFLNHQGISALDLACAIKDLKMVGLMVASLKNPLVKKQALSHSLIYMASLGKMDMVKHLLSLGADPRLADSHGQTALMGAAQSGKLEIVNLMLSLGLSSESKDTNGSTALMYAARSGNLDIFSELELKGGDLGETTREGNTLLMEAAAWKHPQLVSYLLERKLNINARNHSGQTALMLASQYHHFNFDAGIASDDDETSYQARVAARLKDQHNLLEFLISQGADASLKDKEGRTFLHHASNVEGAETLWHPSTSNITFLLGKSLKTDLNAQDAKGRTVLMNAVYADGTELLDTLLKLGANPNVQDQNGNYALLYLVTRQCDTGEAKHGLTPYRSLESAEFEKKLKLLLASGANPKLVNKMGQSAQSVAGDLFH